MTLDEGLPDVLDNTLVADVPTLLVRYGIGERVELRLTPTRIVLLRRGGARARSHAAPRT